MISTKTVDMLESVLNRVRGRSLSEEESKLIDLLICYRKNAPSENVLTDKELIVFLMDDIDKASDWLVEGQTHMAIGVLGQCHANIRKHLSR